MSHQELLETLEHTISTFRHEIGNATNSLKITLDVLRANFDQFDDQKKKDYLERSSKILNSHQKMIEALKTYSRFSVKQEERICFRSFWDRFLSMADDRCSGKGIALIHHTCIDNCHILAEVIALNHVMTSVLDNAVDAVEALENPRVEVMGAMVHDSLQICVKDNGPGIPKRDIPKIFIPLFSTKPGKMGMGLPIARKLLWAMGGGIAVESIYGRWTEAKIRLHIDDGKDRGREIM